MKWLSILIALGFLGVSFGHVLANKTEAIVLSQDTVLFVNKWTGKNCIYVPTDQGRKHEDIKREFDLCWVGKYEMDLP